LHPHVNRRSTGIGSNGNDDAYRANIGPDYTDEQQAGDLPWSRRTLAPRQHVFLQGDDQSHVYIVRAGVVRLYTMLSNGRRQIIGFKSPGEYVALEYGSKHRYSAQAISATELRGVPTSVFYAAAANDPQFLLRLYNVVSASLSDAHDLVVTIAKRDAEESMAGFLLDFDARVSGRAATGDFIALPMLRGDVADYLGLTNETVSRIFTNFKRRGYIEVRGRYGIRLLNRQALRAISDRKAGDREAPVLARPPLSNPAN
jgi:CRP-like cAMP-binding protein